MGVSPLNNSSVGSESAPVTPEELIHHNCINLRLPTKDKLMSWELHKGRKRLHVKVGGQLTFNNAYQMLHAALDDFGLAYIPMALAAPDVSAGRLQCVLQDWFPTFTGHHAYYATRKQSSLAVRLTINALKEFAVT